MMPKITQPIFSSEEREENERRKSELTDLILSEQALLVVGAGSSALLGYPTWLELIDELEIEAKKSGDDFELDISEKRDDPLEYIEKIKSFMEKKEGKIHRYNKKLCDLFCSQNRNIGNFHENLVQLPFKGIITTNYDNVLDSALKSVNSFSQNEGPLVIKENITKPVSDFLLSFDFKKYPKRILHLHGHHEHPETIILSKNDYERFYGLKKTKDGKELIVIGGPGNFHYKFLWSILATRRSVWIGFSMNDPFLNKMLEIVSRDLWRWDEDIHFAIMGIDKEKAEEKKARAEMFKREYGMGIVFYEHEKNDHQPLEHLIAEIWEKYSAKKKQKEEVVVDDTSKKKGDQVPTLTIEGARSLTDWLDKINKRMEASIKINED